ncbi:hypothetical protein BLNAU_16993 [Blattamonas nauphoetae]|uniref:Uncharacterized protein n=1 Tax=Blattamonas nauphoetae TaxID=2049346 RepID=A0ABQ9X7U0_9EUKA|nr:hypothetical protein BLNAU_16993 [Blattamonas nauphoetae]
MFNFSFMSVSLQESSIFVLSGESTTTLTEVDLRNITQFGERGNGVAVRLSGSSSLTVTSSRFDDCASVGDGGIFHSTSSGSISIADTYIYQPYCGETSHGMVIYVAVESFKNSPVTFSKILYASYYLRGLTIYYLSGADLDAIGTPENFKSIVSEEKYLHIGTLAQSQGNEGDGNFPLSYYVYPHVEGDPIHVAADYWDRPTCGRPRLPCTSLSHAVSLVTSETEVVTLISNLSTNSRIESPSCGLEVSSNGSSSKKVALTLGVSAQFSVKDGDLGISNIVLILPSTLAIPVFVVDGKTLTLIDSDNPKSIVCIDSRNCSVHPHIWVNSLRFTLF